MTTPNNTSDTPTKQCTKCGDTYPATTEHFVRSKGNRGGLSTWCKPCKSVYRKRYYKNNRDIELPRANKWFQENRERARENRRRFTENNPDYNKEYYSKNRQRVLIYGRKWKAKNKQRMLETGYAWAKANPDKRRAITRRYKIKNKKKIQSWAKEWERNNRDKRRALNHNYRARKKQADGTHTEQDLQEQYKRQGGKCYYCGCKLDDNWHIEHVIPLSRGGSNDIANIVCSCPSCNQSKHNKLPHEWAGTDKLL